MALNFKIFDSQPIAYGLSTTADGNMHLSHPETAANRQKFLAKQNLNHKVLIAANLSHSAIVKTVNQAEPEPIMDADGLVSSSDVVLSLTVADCFPVFVYHPKAKVVGIVHCGWRGILKGIVFETVKLAGANPENLLVGIGPGIQACHFEIKSDVLQDFKLYNFAIIRRGGKIFADLPKIIRQQFITSGVTNKNVEQSTDCTFKQQNYFSYRGDHPQNLQAMLAYIGNR